jgi:predicted nucleic acid-binding protein
LARKEADALGVQLTGTVGILIKAAQSKLLTNVEADKALAVMIKNGFYSPVDSIRSI